MVMSFKEGVRWGVRLEHILEYGASPVIQEQFSSYMRAHPEDHCKMSRFWYWLALNYQLTDDRAWGLMGGTMDLETRYTINEMWGRSAMEIPERWLGSSA